MTPAQPGLEVSAPWTYREKLFNLPTTPSFTVLFGVSS
jgi:hypothetical protein